MHGVKVLLKMQCFVKQIMTSHKDSKSYSSPNSLGTYVKSFLVHPIDSLQRSNVTSIGWVFVYSRPKTISNISVMNCVFIRSECWPKKWKDEINQTEFLLIDSAQGISHIDINSSTCVQI